MGWFWWFPARQVASMLLSRGLAMFMLTAFIASIVGVACGAVWLLFGLIDAVAGLMPHKPQAPPSTSSQS